MIELRKLAADWTNPHFDGRKRHGTEAHRKFAAGTKIVVRTHDDPMEGATVRVVGVQYFTVSHKTAQEMIALSEPVEITTWDEFRLVNDDSVDGQYTNSKVLELLWQQPEMRPALQAAFAKAQTEE